MKGVDDIQQKQQEARAAQPDSNGDTQTLLAHLSFPFVQSTPSDVITLHMQPSYSNISQTDYDAPNKVQGSYGTQSYMHSKQVTSTITKSCTHSRKSSGVLTRQHQQKLHYKNLFKPVGGGGAKPVKDPFLPRYSQIYSDDEDKLLDMGDENIDDINKDYSLN